MNKRMVVGLTDLDLMIKESCGCRGCVVATAAVSPNGDYEEKRKESEVIDAESGGQVRLREIVIRINEQAAKLRIIKSVAEKSPSPHVALV